MSEFLLRPPKLRPNGVAGLLHDSDSDNESYVDQVLRNEASTTAPSWLRRVERRAPHPAHVPRIPSGGGPSPSGERHAPPSLSPLKKLPSSGSLGGLSSGDPKGASAPPPPPPSLAACLPEGGKARRGAGAQHRAAGHSPPPPSPPSPSPTRAEPAAHGRVSAELEWQAAATLIGHYRPVYTHTPEPFTGACGNGGNDTRGSIGNGGSGSATEPSMSIPGFAASLCRNLGMTLSSVRADAAEARRMLLASREMQQQQQQQISASPGALVAKFASARTPEPRSASLSGQHGQEWQELPQQPPSPVHAFHVPDASAMDPYTAKERAVVDALSCFRADPVAFALQQANKVMVTLPLVSRQGMSRKPEEDQQQRPPHAKQVTMARTATSGVSGGGVEGAHGTATAAAATSVAVEVAAPPCLLPLVAGTYTSACADVAESVQAAVVPAMPAVAPLELLSDSPLMPRLAPEAVPLTIARQHVAVLAELLDALRAEALAQKLLPVGFSLSGTGRGGGSGGGCEDEPRAAAADGGNDDDDDGASLTPLGAGPPAFWHLPSLALFVPEEVQVLLARLVEGGGGGGGGGVAGKGGSPAAPSGGGAKRGVGAALKGTSHVSALAGQLPALWEVGVPGLLLALSSFVDAYRAAVERCSGFMDRLLSPDLGDPTQAAAAASGSASAAGGASGAGGKPAQLDRASRLLSSIHHAHSRVFGHRGGPAPGRAFSTTPRLQQRAEAAGLAVGASGTLFYSTPFAMGLEAAEEQSVVLSSHDGDDDGSDDNALPSGKPSPATQQLMHAELVPIGDDAMTDIGAGRRGGQRRLSVAMPAGAANDAQQRQHLAATGRSAAGSTQSRRKSALSVIERASSERVSLPRPAYNRGLCLAARDVALRVERSMPKLSARDALSQFGQLTGDIAQYIVFGLKDPAAIVEEFVMKALRDGNDGVLLYPTKLYVGAGWQRHATHGAVTVVLVTTGFQEISYIKKHTNLPITELRRNMKKGQMSKDERLYDLNFIPEHYGVKAVSPAAHPVVCGATVDIVLECPPSVTLACSTRDEAVPTRSLGNTFVDRKGRVAHISAVLPDCAPAKLVVYARHPHELVYMKASTILLRPVRALWNGDLARSTSFPVQHEVFQQLHGELVSPREGTLRVHDGTVDFTFCVKLNTAVGCVSLKSSHGMVPLARSSTSSAAPAAAMRSPASEQRRAMSIAGALASPASKQQQHVPPGMCGGTVGLTSFTRAQQHVATFAVVHRPKPDAPLTLWADDVCVLAWNVVGSAEE